MGVISVDERESVWSKKNNKSRAAPTNQQNITVLPRMICSEGAAKESTLRPQRCRAIEVVVEQGLGFQSAMSLNIVHWSWMIRIEIDIASRN